MNKIKDFYEEYGIIKIIIFGLLGFVVMMASIIAPQLLYSFFNSDNMVKFNKFFKPIQYFMIYYGLFCSFFFVSVLDRVESWTDLFTNSIVNSVLKYSIGYEIIGSGFTYITISAALGTAKILWFVIKIIIFIISIIYTPIIKLSYYLYTSPIYFLSI